MLSLKKKFFSQDVNAWQECEVVVVEDMLSLINRVLEKCVKSVPSENYFMNFSCSQDSHVYNALIDVIGVKHE